MTADELTKEIAEAADKRSRRSNGIASLALLVALVAPVTALWIHFDNRDQAATTRLQEQVTKIDISSANTDEAIYVTNRSDQSIEKVVLRLRYPSNEFRYATLKSLGSCMKWEVTDNNLKDAGVPKVSSDGKYFKNLISAEVSFIGVHDQVWTVLDKKTFRVGGYWDTDFASGHPTKEFTKNSRKLEPNSFDEDPKCST